MLFTVLVQDLGYDLLSPHYSFLTPVSLVGMFLENLFNLFCPLVIRSSSSSVPEQEKLIHRAGKPLTFGPGSYAVEQCWRKEEYLPRARFSSQTLKYCQQVSSLSLFPIGQLPSQ